MKKLTFIIALLAIATMMSCGGGGSTDGNKSGEEVIIMTDEFASDTCLARRICRQIMSGSALYESIDWSKPQITSPDKELCYFEGGDDGSVYCYDMHDGRYAVLFEEYGVYMEQYSYKSYILDKNRLTPCDTIFPKPGINDFYANACDFPKLAHKLLSKLIADNHHYWFAPERSSVIVGFTRLLDHPYAYFSYSGQNGDNPRYPGLEYAWTGKKFVPKAGSDYCISEGNVKQLEYRGLEYRCFASECSDSSYLYFGDAQLIGATGSLDGFYSNEVALAENLECGKQAKLSVYTRDEASGFNGVHTNYCVGTYRITDVTFLPDEKLKVSVTDEGNKNPRAYYLKFFHEGGDKLSLRLVGGEKGGKVYNFPNNLCFLANSFHLGEDIFELCDMNAVWEQIDKTDEDLSATLEYSPNTISYELGLYYMRQRFVKSFYMGDNAFRVVDLYNFERWYDDNVTSYEYHIAEYDFKDGKLTPVELQPELEVFNGEYNASFDGDTLDVVMWVEFKSDFNMRERAKFLWNQDAKKFDKVLHLNPKQKDGKSEVDDGGYEKKVNNMSEYIEQLSEFNDVLTAKGDLNNDGVPDYVIGIKGNDHTPGSIAIYNGTEKGFGVVSGGGILQSLCLHVKDLMNLSITDKGVLRIETVYEGESTTTLVYMVRYEEGDYYLIGGKDDMDGNATSYNFLTGKKAVGKQTFDLPDRPLIPFARLKVGYFERGGEIFQEIE